MSPSGSAGGHERKSTSPSGSAGGHLLVVDDNDVNQEVARRMLEQRGHRVDVADNGLEAVAAHCANRYDAILMDCRMPVMDGYEATRSIRAMPGRDRVPIIAMTAATMAADVARCRAAGMDDHVAKPVRWHQLAGVLARWIPEDTAVSVVDLRTGPAPDPPPEGVGENEEVVDLRVVADLRDLFAGGDVATLVQVFLDHARPRTEQLRATHAAGDTESFRRVCHDIRGSSASLGAARLAARCAALEATAVAGRLPPAAAVEEAVAELADTGPALCAAFSVRAPSPWPPPP